MTHPLAFIYTITNQNDGLVYVGIAKNPALRWREHRKRAGKPPAKRQYLHKAIALHGKAAFVFEVVACAACWADGLLVERALIQQYGCLAPRGYNLTDGGEGALGRRHSDETRAKIGAASRARKHTPETRAAIGAAQIGRKHSEASKEKRRLAMTGRKLPIEHYAVHIGAKRSPEARAKMRATKALRRLQRVAGVPIGPALHASEGH